MFDVRDLIDDAVASRRRLGDTRPAIEDPGGGESLSPADWEGQRLRRVIVETIEPASWQGEENRYTSGVIHYWSGRLIVSNRPNVQKRIGDLLERLRDSRAEESKKQ